MGKIRRDKKTPCRDFWHTMRVGLAVWLVLMCVLPRIIG